MSLAARMGSGLRALTGWRRAVAAFALGALSATAFAPLGFFPAILIGYAGLLLLLDGADTAPRPLRRAFSIGWFFFLGQFLIGLHWIGYPFLINPEAHLWMMPFAVVSMPAGLAPRELRDLHLGALSWIVADARPFSLLAQEVAGQIAAARPGRAVPEPVGRR